MMVCIEAKVSVLVPPANVAVYISNSNGDIYVDGNFTSNFTSFTATTVNGDIHIENVNASSISAQSTNGDVTVSNVATGSLQTTSTNGDINVDESRFSLHLLQELIFSVLELPLKLQQQMEILLPNN